MISDPVFKQRIYCGLLGPSGLTVMNSRLAELDRGGSHTIWRDPPSLTVVLQFTLHDLPHTIVKFDDNDGIGDDGRIRAFLNGFAKTRRAGATGSEIVRREARRTSLCWVGCRIVGPYARLSKDGAECLSLRSRVGS
jgi:hypothetical protein